jgi:hypothetical protein
MALYYSASSTQQVMPVGATDPGTYYISMQPVTNGRTNSHYAGANITYNASAGSLALSTVNVNMLNVNAITVNGTMGAPGQFLTTSSSGLRYAIPSAIANGLSNVTIGTTNGSITMGAGGGPGLTYDASGNLTIGGNLTVLGTTTTVLNETAQGSIVPSANITYNLGSPTAYFGTIYAGQCTVNTVTATSLGGTLTTAGQPNITSLGTLSSLAVSGATTAAAITSSGTIIAATVNAGTIGNSGAVLYGTLNSSSASQPNITTLAGVTSIGASGSTTLTGTLQTASQTNITSVGTLTGLTVSGAIVPNSNVTVNLGSTTAWWNNIYGTAIHALYADLAENYVADRPYLPGTVLQFGSSAEVTQAEVDTTRIAGIVSTNPAHLMNGALSGPNVVAVALLGRVPCMVIGPVAKGDILVSAGFGYARVNNNPAPGQAIGKALEDFVSSAKAVIEVVVGRI